MHFTGLILLRMVTATVQHETTARPDQSNRNWDVLQRTPLLCRNRCRVSLLRACRMPTGNATKCQCIQEEQEEQLGGTQLPSLGCHGASEAHGCEHLQAEEGWAKGEEPSVVELHVAHPCFLLPAITGCGDTLLCGTIRA